MFNRWLKRCSTFLIIFSVILATPVFAKSGIVVVQSDFGLKDGAVSAMKGVMYSVDQSLVIADLTNEIPAYQIWDAAYRLHQTAPYWPEGTVFVSIVDPGVGTTRRSVVALANNGQYFVTPDNGTLTLINDTIGIKELRQIDESKNRLKGSGESYTFHGRDVYAYTAARLASKTISFEEVGPVIHEAVVQLPYQKATVQKNALYGTVVILDPQYGNIWTNINKKDLAAFNIKPGEKFQVNILKNNTVKYTGIVSFHNTFGEVKKDSDLLYFNSLLNVSLATNQGNFAKQHQIGCGNDWSIVIKRI